MRKVQEQMRHGLHIFISGPPCTVAGLGGEARTLYKNVFKK